MQAAVTGNDRAQVGIEYLFLTGFLLVVIAAAVIYALFVYNGAVANSAMVDSLEEIEQAVNYVHALGPGSSIVVEIDLPTGVVDGKGENNTVDYNVDIGNTMTYYYTVVDGNIARTSMPVIVGRHLLNISMVNDQIIIREA